MAQNYASLAGTVKASKVKTLTPQTQPIEGRESEQVVNPAGGYSFVADDWARLDRFLILGVPGNTMYQSQKDLVKENAGLVKTLLAVDGLRVVEAAATVLRESRAIKVDAPLFVLALAASVGDDITKARALAVLPEVVRIPTHLFTFIEYINSMRGWGRALRRAVASYYQNSAVPTLAMHAWKYKSRNGWSHRDALRLSHAEASDPARNAVLRYMARGELPVDFAGDRALDQIMAAEALLHTTDAAMAVKLIRDHRLTREAVPTDLLNNASVWEALLEDMPVTALVRNLGKMSSVGLLAVNSRAQAKVIEILSNQDQITRSRIHPMQVYVGLRQYDAGHGFRGSNTWTVNRPVVDALDSAYYLSFGNVEKTGKRILLAIDDSGSMRSKNVMDGIMSSTEAAAAMALVTFMIEPQSIIIGYAETYRDIDLTRKATINSLIAKIGQYGSGTNTALPVHYALDKKLDFDAIVSWTDNNTWAGGYSYGSRHSGHVTEVLRNYQSRVGHPVRFINASMEANSVSDVDSTNPNMFELAGMDSNTPHIISEFIAGRI